MGIYRKISYKVEDLFVKLLTKKQEEDVIKKRVLAYRSEAEKTKAEKKNKQSELNA